MTEKLPVLSDDIVRRHAMAPDASHYLETPASVGTATDVFDVRSVLTEAGETDRSVTFRSGGTSLSGQAVSGSILLDTRRGFRNFEVLKDGLGVRTEPGVVLRTLNAALQPYGRRIGPDPASESACTIGGIIANNSSGMRCGTHENSYQTIRSLRCLLPNGALFDSASESASTELESIAPQIFRTITEIRDELQSDPRLTDKVRQAFRIKNTMGYGLNSFLDFYQPSEILARLLVGSEGTLAFVSEATLDTVQAHPHAATTMLFFNDLATAMDAVPHLADLGVGVIELLDTRSLLECQADLRAADIPHFDLKSHVSLLIEIQAASTNELVLLTAEIEQAIKHLPTSFNTHFTTDSNARARLWKARKGLYATVAGARPAGSTALLEDVAVPANQLSGLCTDLLQAFDRHRYQGSVIFGHAKDGNLHFMLNEDFHTKAGIHRYEKFTEDLVAIVLGRGGSLKAEHGTGRAMAPFVERQYGPELYDMMTRIKDAFDPARILNPGVLIVNEPKTHLHNLKVSPTVDPEVDRCVECGFCEPVCPSKDLTLTPRQRIVLRRAEEAARERGDETTRKAISEAYEYDGIATCAADGMCATACPLDIDTGALTTRLRRESIGRLGQAAGNMLAREGSWKAFTMAARTSLRTGHAVGPLAAAITRISRAAGASKYVPSWTKDIPRPPSQNQRSRPPQPSAEPSAVFFSSCLGRIFEPEGGGMGSSNAFLEICRRAGIIISSAEFDDLCCTTPWSSKGFATGQRRMAGRVVEALHLASLGGALPIVCDATSCTQGLSGLEGIVGDEHRQKLSDLTFVDAIEFTRDIVLPLLAPRPAWRSMTLHPTCSSQSLGLDQAMADIAQAISTHVHIPVSWGCCGFAGDRGFLHPELTESATESEAAEVVGVSSAIHASCNRTCEVGLTRATGQPYYHLIELLELATR